ncbi:MAG: AMP-binding protein [Actinobacteria bacterium]|nr:AMP-binding protein [Actinomycetota bacterium]
MHSLVALDIAPGQMFANYLDQIWDEGDALLPLDQRLPAAAKQQLLKQFGASWLISDNREKVKLDNGFAVEPNDALVIATSGSTGGPKGVVHTHESIIASVIAGGDRLGCSSIDHWLSCLPLAHVGGLSVLLRARHYKSELSFADNVDQLSIDAAIKRGADLTSLVPTVLRKLNIDSFRSVLVGGSALLGDMPANAITTYGLTETMGGVAYNGRTLDGAEIQVNNLGEIMVRGAMLFRAYRDGSNPKSESGWFATGDLGEITDGVLAVHGRKDDLINTGGYKVWPRLVENSINQITDITECVVKGLPDETWGQAVCAWIVLQNHNQSLSLNDVRQHVKRTLPDYCAPKQIFIVDQIPRSALGKVRLSDLLNLKD